MDKEFIHPYMPNSVPAIKQEMLKEIGVDKIEDIYRSVIPEALILRERLNLPEPITSEYELKRHVTGILNKNITTEEYTSFLGAGCYKHQVPAVCDEINSRGEFLTGYCGDTYSDLGKMQAIFEYTSMLGELVDCDIVSYTTYDACQSIASAMRMALRFLAKKGSQKTEILVPATMDPDIYAQAYSYTRSVAEIKKIAYDRGTGLIDLDDLKAKLESGNVGAIFIENPSYLGFFETNIEQISRMAHEKGAMVICQPEVAALGIMESPINLGADIVVGDIQPLGMHIQFGGGQAGFIACRQDLELAAEFPTYMYGIAKTDKDGVYGWGRAMNYRSSHGSRENAKEFFGTETGLWGITAGVYLASMGPQGMYELGEMIIRNQNYAIKELTSVPGVSCRFHNQGFQEFVLDYNATGKTAAEIGKELLKYEILGGKDLSKDFPELGETALYCVSELTTAADIRKLRTALEEITGDR